MKERHSQMKYRIHHQKTCYNRNAKGSSIEKREMISKGKNLRNGRVETEMVNIWVIKKMTSLKHVTFESKNCLSLSGEVFKVYRHNKHISTTIQNK